MLYALAAAAAVAFIAGLMAGFVAGWCRRGQVANICADCGQPRGELCGDCDRIWHPRRRPPVRELAGVAERTVTA